MTFRFHMTLYGESNFVTIVVTIVVINMIIINIIMMIIIIIMWTRYVQGAEIVVRF